MSMKIKAEHLEHLKKVLKPLDTTEWRAKCRELGHTNMRYRWDLTYHAKLSRWICDNLYAYLNDEHIDSALRSFIPNLNESGV